VTGADLPLPEARSVGGIERLTGEVPAGMRPVATSGWTRSLACMVENDAAAMSKPLDGQHWERVVPILDQGELGSCTSNAGTGALGTQPFYQAAGATH
jgi:hypothetical protein